jgi:uncharacterized protein (TIGR02001 family)
MLKTLVVASLVASGAVHAEEAAPSDHTVTGYIGLLSSYNLRGITNAPESDTPAVQGSIDYSHSSGFYAGYWFSTLSYNYANLNPDAATKPDGSFVDGRKSLESDFYAGYKGKVGDIGYQVGGTIYYYYPGWESTGYETMLGLTYGSFGLTAQTLLNDVTFGNAGDTYVVASYSQPLPMGFTGAAKLGAYYYTKDGDFVPETADSEDVGFRHLILGVTKPLAATGATMGLDMILGGDDRYGVKQDNKLVASVSMTF